MYTNSYLLQPKTKNFHRKLWDLQLPSKITITIWRISWNYFLSLANLSYKKVTANDRCSRCSLREEDSNHIFRQCPAISEIWQSINLSWAIIHMNQIFWEWLTWVFEMSTKEQCQIFCCAPWFIWKLYYRKSSWSNRGDGGYYSTV